MDGFIVDEGNSAPRIDPEAAGPGPAPGTKLSQESMLDAEDIFGSGFAEEFMEADRGNCEAPPGLP